MRAGVASLPVATTDCEAGAAGHFDHVDHTAAGHQVEGERGDDDQRKDQPRPSTPQHELPRDKDERAPR